MKQYLFALHGFLGQPSDWQFLKLKNVQIVPVDFMNLRGLTPESSLERWGENFNIWVERYYPQGERSLLGYSMGGRLAMHALLQNPRLWKSTIFISANYGIQDKTTAKDRELADQKWAQKFLTWDYATVMREWNNQAVFLGSKKEPNRNIADFDTEVLAKCLTTWSLGRQKYLLPALQELSNSQLWIAGDKDDKYKNLLQTVEGKAQTSLIAESAHRVIFDQPEKLNQILNSFFNSDY